MHCIYVWRPLMEASSTLENIRPPVVSRLSRKLNNCLKSWRSENHTPPPLIIGLSKVNRHTSK